MLDASKQHHTISEFKAAYCTINVALMVPKDLQGMDKNVLKKFQSQHCKQGWVVFGLMPFSSVVAVCFTCLLVPFSS